MANIVTFEAVVDTVRSLPTDQMEILSELLKNWQRERRREEIARDAREARNAYEQGELRVMNVDEIFEEAKHLADIDE